MDNLPINNRARLTWRYVLTRTPSSVWVHTYLTDRRQSHVGKFELPVRQSHVHQSLSEIVAEVGSEKVPAVGGVQQPDGRAAGFFVRAGIRCRVGRGRLFVQVHQTDVAHVRAGVQFEYLRVVRKVRCALVGQTVQHLQIAHHVDVDRVRFNVAQPDQIGQRIYGDVADRQAARVVARRLGHDTWKQHGCGYLGRVHTQSVYGLVLVNSCFRAYREYWIHIVMACGTELLGSVVLHPDKDKRCTNVWLSIDVENQMPALYLDKLYKLRWKRVIPNLCDPKRTTLC